MLLVDPNQYGLFPPHGDETPLAVEPWIEKVQASSLEPPVQDFVITEMELLRVHSEFKLDHSVAVAELAEAIAPHVDVPPEMAYLGGLLHDVGHLHTPGTILHRDGELSDEEYEVAQLHSVLGARRLVGRGLPNEIVVAAARHHDDQLPVSYPSADQLRWLPGQLAAYFPAMLSAVQLGDAYHSATNRTDWTSTRRTPEKVCEQMLAIHPNKARLMIYLASQDIFVFE